MSRLEVVRDGKKGNLRANLFFNNIPKGKKEKVSYWNIIDKDKSKFAQLLIDLYLEGFPVVEGYRIFNERINKKDWLGF